MKIEFRQSQISVYRTHYRSIIMRCLICLYRW